MPKIHSLWGAISLAAAAFAVSPKGLWDTFNYAPPSRTVWPVAVRSFHGSVRGAQQLLDNKGSATLAGNGSWVALDFGKEVIPRLFLAHESLIILDRSAG